MKIWTLETKPKTCTNSISIKVDTTVYYTEQQNHALKNHIFLNRSPGVYFFQDSLRPALIVISVIMHLYWYIMGGVW